MRDARVVPLQSLHVTLAFLGERPEEEVDAIGEALFEAAQPVRGLELGPAAAFGRGRALGVTLRDTRFECAQLRSGLERALVARELYEPEDRRFRPHVTVARGRDMKARRLPAPPATGAFDGEAVTLFRSHLGRGGARYAALVSAPLHVPGH